MNKLFAAGFIVVVFLFGSSFAKSWRGITPLRSTRSEVERALGRPVLSSKHTATFHTDNEAVSIIYSDGLRCAAGANSEWNVPEDRVISITVAPKGIVLFPSLQLDESKYEKSPDPHRLSAFEYTNTDEGVSITVVNGEVTAFRYRPDAASNHLKCPTKANKRPTGSAYKLDEFGDLKKLDEESRLDNFAITLMHAPGSRGYIYSYSDDEVSPSEARSRLRRVKNYLITVRRLKPSRVVALYAGARTDFTIQPFVAPKGSSGPVPY